MAGLSPLLLQATDVKAVRGEGVYLFDDRGRRYLDFTAGIGVTSTGHCHPKVVDATRRQVGTIVHAQYTTVMHPWLLELADRLAERMPGALDSLFFANAGSEAVEAALRLARHATGRPNVIVFQGAFHGRTMGAASMTTSKTAFRAGLQPLMAGVAVAPFPYARRYRWSETEAVDFALRELEHLLHTVTAPAETAAVFVEPVLGEGGYVPTPDGFMRGLRELCNRHGMLLVADEVQTGFGRTGRFWGHEHSGVTPDVIITAKGLASGFPLSAIAAPEALMQRGWPGSQGGTYGGNAVSCAAALATLEVIDEEGLVENAARIGAELLSGLEGLSEKHAAIADVRGRGLMIGVEFMDGEDKPDPEFARQVQRECEREGLLLLTCGTYSNVVRFLPPLVVTSEQAAEGLVIFRSAVERAQAR